MPGRDGKGQNERGSRTGKGFGFCNGANPVGKDTEIGLGQGFGCRRNLRKGSQNRLIELKTQEKQF